LDELGPPGFPGAAMIASVQPKQLEVVSFKNSTVEAAAVEVY
jgi:hypothetical protein